MNTARPPTDRADFGVLLAAGRSTRMGTDKRFLPWPPLPASLGVPASISPGAPDADRTTVIAASFDAIAQWCDRMLVVADDEARVAKALDGRPYCFVRGEPFGAMGDSLRAGLVAAREATRAPGTVVIHLADHPAIRSATVGILLAAWRDAPHRAVTPTFNGPGQPEETRRGGHPVVLPGTLVEPLISALAPMTDAVASDGLRGFWRANPHRRHRVPVEDPGILVDLDLQADYLHASEVLADQ